MSIERLGSKPFPSTNPDSNLDWGLLEGYESERRARIIRKLGETALEVVRKIFRRPFPRPVLLQQKLSDCSQKINSPVTRVWLIPTRCCVTAVRLVRMFARTARSLILIKNSVCRIVPPRSDVLLPLTRQYVRAAVLVP